jgi:hypothetical protein
MEATHAFSTIASKPATPKPATPAERVVFGELINLPAEPTHPSDEPLKHSDAPASVETKPKSTRKKMVLFTEKELVAVIHKSLDINPFYAKHGDKKAAWDRVANAVTEMGFPSRRTESVKHKALALLKYHRVSSRIGFIT